MKEWKHLSLDQRKVISSGISHNYKLRDIGESLGFDPTSISKEVKRNRIATSVGLNIQWIGYNKLDNFNKDMLK